MEKGLAFWICVLVGLLIGLWLGRGVPAESRGFLFGWAGYLFLLVILVGWEVFGAPLKG